MSSRPRPSALDAHTQAFPTLTEAQIARIRAVGKLRQVKKDEILFDLGDTNVPFFVLLSGRMEIVQPDLRGEHPVAKHGPGEFTGEMTMISGRRCLVRGRVTESGEFLEVSGEALRSLVARDAELSEIFHARLHPAPAGAHPREATGNVILLGSRHSAKTLRLREFLTRNGHPFAYVDLDSDQTSQELLDRFDIKLDEIPVVVCNARTVLRNPSIQELADCLGLNSAIDESEIRDLIIVGAGPAGLAAAVYAASEGLDVLVIETGSSGRPGGLEFQDRKLPGLSDGTLRAGIGGARHRPDARNLARKMMVAHGVLRLDCDKRPLQSVPRQWQQARRTRHRDRHRRAIQQAAHRQSWRKFEGQGIYYGATFMESQLCEQEEIIVVGGGNSAGQAPFFCRRRRARCIFWCARIELAETMSRYLVQRIEENPAIELHHKTEIVALDGDTHLEQVTWRDKSTGQTSVHDIRHVFIMAGASPRTEWLQRVHRPRRQGVYPYRARSGFCKRRRGFAEWRGLRTCWRPVFPACLPWAMFAQVT